jgi:heme/copper-type cytochrome/quinol oxidase subunit 1
MQKESKQTIKKYCKLAFLLICFCSVFVGGILFHANGGVAKREFTIYNSIKPPGLIEILQLSNILRGLIFTSVLFLFIGLIAEWRIETPNYWIDDLLKKIKGVEIDEKE